MASEELLEAGQEFKDIALGELNDLSFDMESPLITEELNGKSLVSYLMDGLVERKNVFDIKKQHKGLVLLATQVQTAGPVNPAIATAGQIRKEEAVPIMRNFAIVRVPELHGHIPSPDMRLLMDVDKTDPSGRAQLSNGDKVKLSMHDAFFSSPTSHDDMPQLKSGDIVMLDGDGLIIKLVEPATLDSFGPPKKGNLQSAYDWAKGKVFGSKPTTPDDSGYPGEASTSLDDLEPAFKDLIEKMIQELSVEGFEYTIRETWRSAERQQYYLSKEWTTTEKSQHMNMDSAGNYASNAIDLIPKVELYTGNRVPCSGGSGTGREITNEAAESYLKLLEVAEKYGLTTGGSWFGVKQCHGTPGLGWDPGHVQYAQNKAVNVIASSSSVGGSGNYGNAEADVGEAE